MKSNSTSTRRPGAGPLYYTGAGFVAGVPARDLALEDQAQLAQQAQVKLATVRRRLLASGLYTRRPAAPAVPAPPAD